MEQDDYRIIIPAKGDSKRAPEKNSLLLRWTLEYVGRLGLENKSSLISQHAGYLTEASSRGIKAIKESQAYPDQNLAITQAILDLGWEDKFIILLQPTQPLRQHWLLQKCLEQVRSHPDTLVTTRNTRDEKQFTLSPRGNDFYASTVDQKPMITACIFAAHASTFTGSATHLEMWQKHLIRMVKHRYPGNLDFDYPEDMLLSPMITHSVFDLFFYSQT